MRRAVKKNEFAISDVNHLLYTIIETLPTILYFPLFYIYFDVLCLINIERMKF